MTSHLPLASAGSVREAQDQFWWSSVGAKYQQLPEQEKGALPPLALALAFSPSSAGHYLSLEQVEITPGGRATVSVSFSFGEIRLPTF
ncbi:hypothetical protein WG901_08755 [Novosphingobium sp. PS1R-30]|uniref:Uncharacterized protein n=1 Tax=Novosphingobium anseongense TaxID=3133436 RepID=A0ABU8RUH1_9SPHN